MLAQDLDQYHHFAVFGLAKSGIAAANFLARRGKSVTISDPSPSAEGKVGELIDGVQWHIGDNVIGDAECVILSPGLSPHLPLFRSIPSSIPTIPEVELARAGSRHRWVGVTGTDGKTTTTEMIAHTLEALGTPARAAGNIGIPLCDVVDEVSEDTIIVAELSAFQLWSAKDLFLESFVVTNLAPDHLDYFEQDYQRYIASKLDILFRDNKVKFAILNNDDKEVHAIKDHISKSMSLHTYGLLHKNNGPSTPIPNIYYDREDDVIVFPDGTKLSCCQTKLRGIHNIYNIMAAAGAIQSLGYSYRSLIEPLRSYEAGAHRIEYIGTFGGVSWINDSKATNPHASQAGMDAIQGPLIGIIGGVDKQLDLEDYAHFLSKRLKGCVIIGEISNRLEAALLNIGVSSQIIKKAGSLSEAVDIAYQMSEAGDHVILSPACSSFDMFRSYEDRGNRFRDNVKEKFQTA